MRLAAPLVFLCACGVHDQLGFRHADPARPAPGDPARPAPGDPGPASGDAVPTGCELPSDCPLDDACAVPTCNERVCGSERRHDGLGWRVEPRFTSEVKLGDDGVPVKALYDGERFLVWMSLAEGTVARQVSREGEALAAFPIDPLTTDLTVVRYTDAAGATNVRYYGVTNEAPDQYTQYTHVAAYVLDATGAPVGVKATTLASNGVSEACDGTLGPAAVAASGSHVLAIAGLRFCFEHVGYILDLATGVYSGFAQGGVYYRFRGPRPAAKPDGFIMTAEDLSMGGGHNGVGGSAYRYFDSGPIGFGNLIPSPFDRTNGGGLCCWGAHSWIWGNDSSLVLYGLPSADVRAQAFDAAYHPLGAELVFQTGAYRDMGADIQAGFDGTSFFVVSHDEDEQLPGRRILPDGTLLDTTPISLTPDDASTESHPKLAYDRAGRYLIAYQKHGHVYARLFSTCP